MSWTSILDKDFEGNAGKNLKIFWKNIKESGKNNDKKREHIKS